MKKGLKTATSSLLALSLMSTLVACSRSEAPASAPAPKTNDQGQPAAQKEITLTWSFGKDATGVSPKLAKMFEEKNPGIKVNVMEMPQKSDAQHNDYVTKLSSKDTSIDVMNIDIIWPPEFGASQWLEPLDSYFTKDELDKFLPGPIAGNTYNGKLYGLPYYTDAGLLYYRKDILEEAGVQPPKTFDELMNIAKTLKGKGGTEFGVVYQANQYEGLVCNVLEYIWGNGGDVLTPDNKVVLDSPNTVEAIKNFAALTQSDLVPKGITTYIEDDARTVFTEGKSVFLRHWPSAWAAAQGEGSKVKGKVGIVPMPVGPSGKNPAATLGGWNLGINVNISKEKKEAAVKLIKFLTSDEAQTFASVNGGRIPIKKALFKNADVLKANPHFESMYDVFMNAKPRPVSPIYPQISDVMQIQVHKAITGAQPADQAVKNMQKEIGDLLAKYKK
ncbi:ABC transporter substrate-binding protein [Paenibacillus hamazuiensis]|uniref:ABC transporter substrate-binding protein n=1 Tax=Paenibacillus hamazuiensis TaxID=2936508 RepID=UPI00200EF3E5|nr:ABC transporter substrate-binding protein [Paenibacillus hamazuiensis]